MKFEKALIFLFILLIAPISQAFSQSRLPDLEKGLGFNEVTRLWGPPAEKQEFEAKRYDVWIYPNARVYFHEGRVATWSEGNEAVSLRTKTGKEAEQQERAAHEVDSVAVEDILTEIMKESPTPDEPAAPNPGGPSGVGEPRPLEIMK